MQSSIDPFRMNNGDTLLIVFLGLKIKTGVFAISFSRYGCLKFVTSPQGYSLSTIVQKTLPKIEKYNKTFHLR